MLLDGIALTFSAEVHKCIFRHAPVYVPVVVYMCACLYVSMP